MIVHGTNGEPNHFKPLRNEIEKDLCEMGRSDKWDIRLYDWSENARGLLPPNTASHAHGIYLAECILEQIQNGYNHIHLIGHSIGCRTIDTAAKEIASKSNVSIHLTFLDAYCPNDELWQKEFGSTCTWAEHYYTDKGLPYTTNIPLECAININVTQLRDLYQSDKDYHGWPIEWYTTTVINYNDPCEMDHGYGFLLSKECNPNKWNSCPPQVPEKKGIVTLPSMTFNKYASAEKKNIVTLEPDKLAFGISATGSIVAGPESLTLTTGSPAWIDMKLPSEKLTNIVEFDYQFTSDFDANSVISIYLDYNEPIELFYHLPGNTNIHNSGLIALPSDIINSNHVFTLRLDSLDGYASSVNISNIHTSLIKLIEVPKDYPTIQEAIDAAQGGETIAVDPNTYNENINFNGKNITLTSTDPQDSSVVASTIIDGSDGNGSVVIFENGETSDCVLTGFTITGGNAENGGGIFVNGAEPTISHCVIKDNTATDAGGGVYAQDSIPDLHLINSDSHTTYTIHEGDAGSVADIPYAYDGDWSTYSQVTSNGDSFEAVVYYYEEIWNLPDIAYDLNFHFKVQASGHGQNTFAVQLWDPQASAWTDPGIWYPGNASGLYDESTGDSSVAIPDQYVDNGVLKTRVMLWSKKSTGAWTRLYETSISVDPEEFLSKAVVNNCVITNNNASDGGGIYAENGIISNCTIVNNSSGIENFSGTIINSILWGNETFQLSNCSAPIYCCIQNGTSVNGCIIEDALFADSENGDYHLLPSSPCIDAGDPCSVYSSEPWPNGGRTNMGAYGGTPEATHSRDGLAPAGFEIVNKTRVGRTTYQYDLALLIQNQNDYDVTNVQAQLVDATEAILSVEDDQVTFTSIPASQTAESDDTFTITVDRANLIEPGRLTWDLIYYETGGTQITQSMIISMTSEDLEINGTLGDVTGDDKVNLEDFAKLANFWLQNEPSANLSPPDDIVDIYDLVELTTHWLDSN